jgi:alpha-glucosidase
MPWFDEEASFGFSPAGALGRPWLPQPREWRGLSAAEQLDDPRSMATLYRQALSVRRGEPALGSHDLTWLPAPAGVLAFTRTGGFACVVNMSSSPLPLPPRHQTLLASGEISGLVPSDTAVWLRARDAGDVTTEWPLAG